MKTTTKTARQLAKTIKSLKEPVGARNEYLRELLSILKAISRDFEETINKRLKTPLYTADSLEDDLKEDIEKVIKAWSGEAFRRLAFNRAERFVLSVVKSTSKRFGIDRFKSPLIQSYLKRSIALNTQLITSLASDHANAIANLVFQNVTLGARPTAIVEAIKTYGVTKARAKLIAFDQVAKALGQISRLEQQSAGFEYFRWLTSKDERVREAHKKLAERKTPYGIGVYRWDDPPTIDGRKVIPGTDIRCRCVAIPVPDWEVKEFQGKK